MDEEIWKQVPDFPGYEVSNFGRVRSYWRLGHGCCIADKPQRILKERVHPDGRVHVTLRKYPNSYTVFNARLVMHVFVGPRPAGMEVCHNDGNPANNYLDNLRYDTHLENAHDWVEQQCGLRTPRRDAEIREKYKNGTPAEELAKEYGIGIHRIKFYICADSYRERHTAKLQRDLERAEAMRYDRATGMTYDEIGEKYSMHSTSARSICIGVVCKDAPGPIAPTKRHI